MVMEQIKSFKILPEEAINIRTKVFVEEQGFKEELDTIDKIAEHLILFVDDNPIGTCRYYKKDDYYYFGRLAILKEYRNKNYGGLLLKETINNLKKENAHKVFLNSQLSAKDFYIKHGFLQEGEVFYEEGCPHIKMYLKLGE